MIFSSGFIKTALQSFKMKATPAKHGGRNGRKKYTLTEDGGKWSCTCLDYFYRQAAKGGECKHIRAHKAGKKAWELDRP